jgi:hypothetical protein
MDLEIIGLDTADFFSAFGGQGGGFCLAWVVRYEHMFDSEILPEISKTLPAEEAGLPRDLELIEPGPFLSVLLSGIDRSPLSGHDQIRLLQARARQVASNQAELLADMWRISETIVEIEEAKGDDAPGWDPYAIASSEIGTALHLTRRGADDQLGLAYQLKVRLPQVWEALHKGLISLAQARILADQTSHLPQELAEKVTDVALERAPDQTTGQLRARLQRLIIQADPAAAKDRYQTPPRRTKDHLRAHRCRHRQHLGARPARRPGQPCHVSDQPSCP